MKANLRTPLQLVQLIILGSLLLIASWALDFLPFHEPPQHSGFWMTLWSLRLGLLVIGVFLTGATMIWRAYVRLGEGIRLTNSLQTRVSGPSRQC